MCQDATHLLEQAVTFFYTSDLETRAQFWGETIGLSEVLDQGTSKIYRISQDGFIGFCEHQETSPTYNIYHAFLRGPSGYLVEIQRFEDPSWPKPSTSP